jgi:hypothetical protein
LLKDYKRLRAALETGKAEAASGDYAQDLGVKE